MSLNTYFDELRKQLKPDVSINACNVDFSTDIVQVNGCRTYGNPPQGWLLPTPTTPELFIKNLPREFLEKDILPHFARFGQIYSFRLLMGFDSNNRGYGYLKYATEKSTILALEIMNYYIPMPAITLDIQKSYEKSRLFVMDIPNHVENNIIRDALRHLFPEVCDVYIKRPKDKNLNGFDANGSSCAAILQFPDHSSALRAKQFGSTGAFYLWNRTIKVMWAKSIVKKIPTLTKHLVIHNMPYNTDPEDFFKELCNYICPHEVLSISPFDEFWLLEFSNHEIACTILEILKTHKQIVWANRSHYTFKMDFDAQLRLQCVANYWEMPIFIYGRVVHDRAIQTVAVIIKNNCKNQFTVFFIELIYDKLVEMHSKVCEIIMKCIGIFGNLPKNHIVLKYEEDKVYIMGIIINLECPVLLPPSTIHFSDQISIYLAEIYDLAAMCHKLCTMNLINIYLEYQDIIKKKSIYHQFISDVISNNRILACIDSKYRKCKQMKIGIDNKQIILVMCDIYSKNNVDVYNIFPPKPVKMQCFYSGNVRTCVMRDVPFYLKENANTQAIELHNCYRSHIEFGVGYDQYCMPFVFTDPEKTPTNMKRFELPATNLHTLQELDNLQSSSNAPMKPVISGDRSRFLY